MGAEECGQKVCYMYSKYFLQNEKNANKANSRQVSLAVRKCKLKGKKYSVAQILDSTTADSIVRLNEGYHVLRNLRGSPPYWEKAKKDIFAMIRQLGIPTWFCSFSAAETMWTPLLQTLERLINHIEYTEDVLKMSWEEKCKLIKADPVTCARYFDYRFQRFSMKSCATQLTLLEKLLISFTE